MARLPLKYVHQFRDRHGRLRHYFRRRTGKAIPLPGLFGSEEFMAAYQAALATIAQPVEIGESRTNPGTIDALAIAYYKTTEFEALVPKTSKTFKRIIEAFRIKNGSKKVTTLQRDNIESMMAVIPNVHAKRYWLRAIRALMKAAIPTMRKDDPTAGVGHAKRPKSDGFHNWTDEEIGQYRNYWQLGTQQRLVMEFALEAVSRRCEILRLGPQHIKDGRIRIKRAKGSKDVDILVTPELQAACDAMPKVHALYILNLHGKQRSVEGLGTAFAQWATDAGLPKRCRLHGLKKGGMRRLAEAEATTKQIMAISGHRKLSEVERYTEAADQKRLADAGMKKRMGNADVANLSTPNTQTR
jgi:hypothetical protein